MDKDRRNWLIATSAVGGVGAAAALYPFVDSFEPSERAKAAGAAVEIDIAGMKPDEMRMVEWRGKPVWIIRRTRAMLASLRKDTVLLRDPFSKVDQQPAYACNIYRSIKPEYVVLIGLCTHLGCSPRYVPQADDKLPLGGFYCPCHGSCFDLAGRVFKHMPAPINLAVPPYRFISEQLLEIGEPEHG
jgi:ubiquinol-cytochrome c reductase iron-sulfur subunit